MICLYLIVCLIFLNRFWFVYYLTLWEFFTPALTDSFSLKSEWQQSLSRTIISIMDDFRSTVVFMFSILPLISGWSNFQVLVDCSKSPSYDKYHSCFCVPQFPQQSDKVQIFVLLFTFILWFADTKKSTVWQGLLAWFRWSGCITKSQKILYISFLKIDSLFYI